MKKAWILLLTALLVWSLMALTASAEEAYDPYHCQCGAWNSTSQTAAHKTGCSGELLEWTPLTAASQFPQEPGNYYLTENKTFTSSRTLTAGTAEEVSEYNVDFNGYTITITNTGRFLSLYQKSYVHVGLTDTSAAGNGGVKWTSVSSASTQGVLTFFSSATDCKHNVLTIFGGIYDASARVVSGSSGVLIAASSGSENTVNVSGGTLIGGKTASANGGTIYMVTGNTLNIYGGTITGGSAKTGGNVYSTGKVNMSGGTVENGKSTGNGGNILVSGANASLILTGGTVQNGTTGDSGGNLFAISGALLRIQGGLVTGGSKNGDVTHNSVNIFINNSTLDLQGGTVTGGIRAMNVNTDSVKVLLSGNPVVTAPEGNGLLLTSTKTDSNTDPGRPTATIVGPMGDLAQVQLNLKDYSISLIAQPGENYAITQSDIAAFHCVDETIKPGLSEGNMVLVRKVFVAQVNGVQYESLDEAMAQAISQEQPLTMLNDAALSQAAEVENLTLDLAGFSFTGHITATGTVTIQNDTNTSSVYTVKLADEKATLVGAQQVTAVTTDVDGFEVIQNGANYGLSAAIGAAQVGLVQYATFEEALAAVSADSYIKLLRNVQSDAVISGSLYLDLNGHTLSGVTVTGTLYGMDSATDAYSDENAGTLSCTLSGAGTVVPHHKTSITGKVMRYLTAQEDGTYSFHRFYIGITTLSIRPDSVGVGYKATVAGDAVVKARMEHCSYTVWLEGGQTMTFQKDLSDYTPGEVKQITLRINQFLKEGNDVYKNMCNAQMAIHATVSLTFQDMEPIEAAPVAYSFRQMAEAASDSFAYYTEDQQQALAELMSQFNKVTLGWDIPSYHHRSEDGWLETDRAVFISRLTKSSGIIYNLAEGKYVLTEDISLVDNETIGTVRIAPGKEVTICLNGHTLSGDDRIFRNYGTLNICDCQSGEHEGTVTSSYGTEDPSTNKIYAPVLYTYYNSETNLYGGTLKATGTVYGAGVIALSRESSDEEKLPSVMNLYGGRVEGSNLEQPGTGGVFSVWNGATLNIYDGVITGGVSAAGGGAIQNSKSNVNLYGGIIQDCVAGGEGGAINNHGNTQMSGGTIAGCYVYAGVGGAIYNNSDGVLNISGGTIDSCFAVQSGKTVMKANGGGISNNGTMQMSGGTIQNCGANGLGGGIYAAKSFTVSGTPVIQNNLTDLNSNEEKASNVYLPLGVELEAQELKNGACVGITAAGYTTLTQDLSGADTVFSDEGYTVGAVDGKTVLIPGYASIGAAPAGLSVGFGRADVSPGVGETGDYGLGLGGYGTQSTRRAVNVLDQLYITTVAVTDEAGQTVLLISCDTTSIPQEHMDAFLHSVSSATGVPKGNIVITATHTHSVPMLTDATNYTNINYLRKFADALAQSAHAAMLDRQAAVIQTGDVDIDSMNHYRHYVYTAYPSVLDKVLNRNGVTEYCGDNFGESPEDDPDSFFSTVSDFRHVDSVDTTMHLVRFVREGKDILMANWRAHPTVTGGNAETVVSADTIGAVRSVLEGQDPDLQFVYFQGAAGNINAQSRIDGENAWRDTSLSKWENCQTYGQQMAQVILDTGISSLETQTETGRLQIHNNDYSATLDIPEEEAYTQAKTVQTEANKKSTVSEKNAICKENGYESIYEVNNIVNRYEFWSKNGTVTSQVMNLNCISLGRTLAFFTAPGELYDDVSVEVEGASHFASTFCLGYANGHFNYFVYNHSTEYRSYEQYNHRFVAPDTINAMISYWKSTLTSLYDTAS